MALSKDNAAREMKKSKYSETYTSFSGADIVAVITPEGGSPLVLGELQTISYSVYRPAAPVFALGRVTAKGVVRGARTVAGSLIFTVFDRHVLYEVMNAHNKKHGYNINNSDEIPPFDITVNFFNEYGQSSQLVIKGVHLMSEGQTMSIEDMITESTMEYIAIDVDTMIPDLTY